MSKVFVVLPIAAVMALCLACGFRLGVNHQRNVYDHEAVAAYQRGVKDATAQWKPAFDHVAEQALHCSVTQTGDVNVTGNGNVAVTGSK